jgi:hypothetical protein
MTYQQIIDAARREIDGVDDPAWSDEDIYYWITQAIYNISNFFSTAKSASSITRTTFTTTAGNLGPYTIGDDEDIDIADYITPSCIYDGTFAISECPPEAKYLVGRQFFYTEGNVNIYFTMEPGAKTYTLQYHKVFTIEAYADRATKSPTWLPVTYHDILVEYAVHRMALADERSIAEERAKVYEQKRQGLLDHMNSREYRDVSYNAAGE